MNSGSYKSNMVGWFKNKLGELSDSQQGSCGMSDVFVMEDLQRKLELQLNIGDDCKKSENHKNTTLFKAPLLKPLKLKANNIPSFSLSEAAISI